MRVSSLYGARSVDDRLGQWRGSGPRADWFPRNDSRHGQQAAGDGADRLSASEGSVAWHRQFLGGELGPEQNEFTYTFEPFPAPTAKAAAAANRRRRKGAAEAAPVAKSAPRVTLQFTLRDTDGLKARDPIFLTLVAVPDEPPEVKVRLVGTREPVVTPKGRLPVTGTISDDHGLGRVWWDYTVEERAAATIPAKPSGDSCRTRRTPPKPRQRSGEVPLAELPKHLPEYVVKEADVNASQLSLATGQRLTLAVRAADLCTLGNGPNIGSGESWQLDVVSRRTGDEAGGPGIAGKTAV